MKILLHGLSLVAILLLGSQFAEASPRMLKGGNVHSQPGHAELCKRYPDECRPNKPGFQLKMSKKLWILMENVNDNVNRTIRPIDDAVAWGKDKEEYWTYPVDNRGDCEDYVLLKRRTLIEHGVPVSSLLITVVNDSDGEGHAVLTVTTNKGDFILDNLDTQIRRWDETDYQYVRRQSASHSGEWVYIIDNVVARLSTVRNESVANTQIDAVEQSRRQRLIASPILRPAEKKVSGGKPLGKQFFNFLLRLGTH